MAKTANKLPLAASCQLWQLPVAATRSVHMRRRAQCAAVSIRSCDRYLTFFGDQLTLHAAACLLRCSGGTTHNSCALYLSQSYALRSCADMDSGIMPQTEWGMPAQAGSSSRNGFQGIPAASQVSCCSALLLLLLVLLPRLKLRLAWGVAIVIAGVCRLHWPTKICHLHTRHDAARRSPGCCLVGAACLTVIFILASSKS